jgi:hypothetical protein
MRFKSLDRIFARISADLARSTLLPLVLIAILNLSAIERAVNWGYFQEDDWHNIKARSAAEVLRTFAGEFSGGLHGAGGFYRPLVRVSFALDRALYGVHPWGYHLTNGILHLLNAALLFFLLRKLTGQPWLALLAAALFSLYPLHPEAVFWLSGRADVLAATFVVLALLLIVNFLLPKVPTQRARWHLFFLSALSFAAALLSKETAVILPLLLLLVALLYRPAESAGASRQKRSLHQTISLEPPFVAVLLAYLLVRTWALGGLGGYQTPHEPIGIKRFADIYDAFISLMVNPFQAGLAGQTGTPGLIPFTLCAFIVLAVFNFPPLLLFGLGWVYLAPLTMLSVAPSALEGGRFLYLPVIGYSIFLSGVVAELYKQAKKLRLHNAVALLAIGLTLLYGFFQSVQTNEWVDASRIVNSLSHQIVRSVKRFGLDKTYVLPNLPAKRGSAFIFRGENIVSALPVLLDGKNVAAHCTFHPEDDENSVVLLVEPTRQLLNSPDRVRSYRIVKKETTIWKDEQLLQWRAGDGMIPLRLEPSSQAKMEVKMLRQPKSKTLAVTEIIAPQFSGLESPPLATSNSSPPALPAGRRQLLWATLELRQLITGGGYGVILWRGAAEAYSERRMGTLFNDFHNRFADHLVNLGSVREIERILIRPTNDVSRILIERVALYTFHLAPY